MDPIHLTEGCELRLLEEDDAEEVFALIEANREHLGAWMPWAADQDLERTANFLRATRRRYDAGEACETAVVLDGRIAGCAGFPQIDRVARNAIIGYWLAEEHQGRGLITRAVGALIDHAFGEWDLHRVEIRAATENVRSRAVPERLGFTQEGLLREAELVGGRWQDLAVYGLLASER